MLCIWLVRKLFKGDHLDRNNLVQLSPKSLSLALFLSLSLSLSFFLSLSLYVSISLSISRHLSHTEYFDRSPCLMGDRESERGWTLRGRFSSFQNTKPFFFGNVVKISVDEVRKVEKQSNINCL